MTSDDPLTSSYAISRINPAFKDESLQSCPNAVAVGDVSSSGYESRSSSTLSQHWDAGSTDKDRDQDQDQDVLELDGVRQLSEGVSRSATLQAVCRALEVGAVPCAQRPSGFFCHTPAWTEYLGSGIVPGDVTLKAKGYEQVLDLTLDADGADRLAALVELGSRQRCCCRAVTALLALAVFLGAIVLASVAVSRGRRVFGAL